MTSKYHIIPIADLIPHISESYCPCNPYPDEINPNVLIHNAMDMRDLTERITESEQKANPKISFNQKLFDWVAQIEDETGCDIETGGL
jgi:hypothetical protein